MFLNVFETSEVAFMRRTLQRGDVVFDVGANAGLFTVIASKQVGDEGHVYAFEPGGRELELLKHNIAINQIQNVTVLPLAVSNVSGSARFAISRDGAMNSLGQTHHPDQQIERWDTVETIRLDDFVEQKQLDKVDFVKIDVEGAERLVIEGGKRLLDADSKTIVMFESYSLNTPAFQYTPQSFLAELKQQGLSLYYIEPNNQSISRVDSIDHPEFGRMIYSFVVSRSAINS